MLLGSAHEALKNTAAGQRLLAEEAYDKEKVGKDSEAARRDAIKVRHLGYPLQRLKSPLYPLPALSQPNNLFTNYEYDHRPRHYIHSVKGVKLN